MITDGDARILSRQPGWWRWLRRELAPFPGRKQMTVRMVTTVLLVTVISMTLHVPQLAFSAFFIFFVTKENRALTMQTGVIMMAGATIASLISLSLYRFTFDYPELRIPAMAGLVFTGMFLSRVFVVGPLGFVVGFFTALMQTTGEGAPDTDTLVRNTLWLWISIVYPITLTIFVNQVLLPAHPWPTLVRALDERLAAAATALKRIIAAGTAGGQTNPALVEMATRGSSPLLALLNFIETKDETVKRRHVSLVAAIAASEHLLAATAALEFRQLQPLSEADRLCAKMLLAEIAEIQAVLPDHNPVLNPQKSAVPQAELPQLRELQFAVESFRDGLIRYITEETRPEDAKKKPLLVADAFTNPLHVRFALKVTLAAMACYLIYNGLHWPGISTAFVTCCFIALENTGATIRKGWLRLIGCATGGFFGYLAIIFLIPHMESIVSLLLLTAIGAVAAGWVAAGTDRISYGGLQAAFAFFMCIFQGFRPDTSFTTVRDRLLGIMLGIAVSSVVYRYIWPEHAVIALRTTLARVLKNLAQLVRIPQGGAESTHEKQVATGLQSAVTKDLDGSLRLLELVVIENVVIGEHDRLPPPVLERITAHTQSLSLITTALLAKTKLEEWQRLDPSMQQAEIALRTGAAAELQRVAGFIESGGPAGPPAWENSFAAWDHAAAHVTGNDRPRLIRRMVDQIRQLA